MLWSVAVAGNTISCASSFVSSHWPQGGEGKGQLVLPQQLYWSPVFPQMEMCPHKSAVVYNHSNVQDV